MHSSLLPLVVAPDTGAPLTLQATRTSGEEIVDGILICPATGQQFPIRQGVPYFAPEALQANPTARRFGAQWQRRSQGAFEVETLYGQSSTEEINHFLQATQLTRQALAGLRIADVGCGTGRLSRALAVYGAEVVAIDLSATVEQVYTAGYYLPQFYAVQADLHHLPFPDGTFDVVWSNGVLHHTPDPAAAFAAIAAKVKSGGRLAIYVYPTERSVYKQVRWWTPAVQRWPLPLLWPYTTMMAWGIYSLRRVVGKPQPYREVRFRLHDTLVCPYLSMHTPEEVAGWFARNQFDLAVLGEPAITALGMKTLI